MSDGTGDYYGKQNKPDAERQALHVFPSILNKKPIK
jgi:hypothetical protein